MSCKFIYYTSTRPSSLIMFTSICRNMFNCPFWISCTYIWFLNRHMAGYTSNLLMYVVYFSIKLLRILIIYIFFKFLVIISTFFPYMIWVLILVMYLQTVFLFFNVPCKFLLKCGNNVLAKMNKIIRNL